MVVEVEADKTRKGRGHEEATWQENDGHSHILVARSSYGRPDVHSSIFFVAAPRHLYRDW